MKQKILIGSATASGVATISAIVGVLLAPESAHITAKLFAISGILGLLGISLFFVGLAFPKAST